MLEVGLDQGASIGGAGAKWRRQLSQAEVASPEFLAQLMAFLKLQNPAKYDSGPPPPPALKRPAAGAQDAKGGKGGRQGACGAPPCPRLRARSACRACDKMMEKSTAPPFTDSRSA